MEKFSVYIVQCVDKKGVFLYYTGVTSDWERRWKEHKNRRGALMTKQYEPVFGVPVYVEMDKDMAFKMEILVKKLRKNKKLELINKNSFRAV